MDRQPRLSLRVSVAAVVGHGFAVRPSTNIFFYMVLFLDTCDFAPVTMCTRARDLMV